MRKVTILMALAMCFYVNSSGQTNDDYKKTEFYVGYSNAQANETLHGVNGSAVYNFTRYLGVKADFSAAFNNKRFATTGTTPPYIATFQIDRSLYNIVGGIQVKDNANRGRFKPFAHAMIGAAQTRNRSKDFQCSPTANCPPSFAAGLFKDTGFSAIIGGGLDVRLKDRWQLRLFQIDYNPVRSPFGTTDHHMRLGAGIVF